MEKNWSNTSLVAYSALPKIVKTLDLRLARLVNSGFKSEHLKNGVSTIRLIGEIMDVNEEKRKIVNLHFIVTTALDKLTDEQRHLLVGKFMALKTYAQLAEERGLSIRTTYRRVESALAKFASNLAMSGYTEDWFEKEYADVKYVASVKTRLSNEKYFSSQTK